MENAIQRAINHFGLTTDIQESGYILIDGQFLDLSEKNTGGEAGQRNADHRGIGSCYDDIRISGTTALIQFMNDGNIRLSPECGGIDIATNPTQEQLNSIRKYVDYFKGEVVVDISDEKGNNIESKEYKYKTSSSKVINDIKVHFSGRI